jgi:hypothetical protein
MGTQLKRYGTNIAKWGFDVCALHHFNGLGGAKYGKKSALFNFRVISLTTSLGRQLKRVHLRDFETLGLPSRNCFDLLVKIIVVLWHVIALRVFFLIMQLGWNSLV